jgi:succinate-acetate transporter protein
VNATVSDRRLELHGPGLPTPAEDAARQALTERVVVNLRPIASPSSIGLFGLAAGAFALSGLQLDWVAADQAPQVALVLIAFAGVSQLIASLLAFLARDAVVATSMTVLALTWLSIGLVMNSSPPGSTSKALGLLLLASGTFMVLNGLTAALSKLVPSVIFLLAGLRFLTTGLYQLSANEGWKTTSGAIGLVLAALALYGAWAFELEGATKKTVLPLGRRRQGTVAVQGSLFEQVKDVAVEPGVRTQL